MREIFYLIICAASLILFSCTQNNKQEKPNKITTISNYSDSSFVSNHITDIRFYKDHFYFLEKNNQRIVRTDTNLVVVSSWGERGDAPFELKSPLSFCIQNDSIYLLDNRSVKVFTLEGKFVRLVKIPMLIWPTKFAIDEESYFYFSTPYNEKNITKIDINGNIISTFGEQIQGFSSAKKQFSNLTHIYAIHKNILVFYDTYPRIEEYDSEGKLIKFVEFVEEPSIKKILAYSNEFYNQNRGHSTFLELFNSFSILNNEIAIGYNFVNKKTKEKTNNIFIVKNSHDKFKLIRRIDFKENETNSIGWISSILLLNDKLLITDPVNASIHTLRLN